MPIPIHRGERVVWNYVSIIRQVCPDAFEWTPVEWNSHKSEEHVVVGRILMCLCLRSLNGATSGGADGFTSNDSIKG